MEPFPAPESVQFDNVNITHVKDQEAIFNSLDFPSNTFWDEHAYHKAVDGNPNTCWNSYRSKYRKAVSLQDVNYWHLLTEQTPVSI